MTPIQNRLDYVNNEIGNYQQSLTTWERFTVWVHEHPIQPNRFYLAALVVSAGAAIVYDPSLIPSFPKVVWGQLDGYFAVFMRLLPPGSPPHFDMRNHVYRSGQHVGGRLFYEGDVPILYLNYQNPFTAGQAHGYLCGEAIHHCIKRLRIVDYTFQGNMSLHPLQRCIQSIRKQIPPQYLLEMEGIVNGYKTWAEEQYRWTFPIQLSIDDLLWLHLMPEGCLPPEDQSKLSSANHEKKGVACSIIIGLEKNKIVVARNLDWPSGGILGTYSLVIKRQYPNGHSQQELSFPGLVGTTTGMNKHGLVVAMNTCDFQLPEPTSTGILALFYNRMCLEVCNAVETLEQFAFEPVDPHKLPMYGYHLTAVDRYQALSIHFYQGPKSGTMPHPTRRWTIEQGGYLSVLNFQYTPEAKDAPGSSNKQRTEKIENFFRASKEQETEHTLPIEEVLLLPTVNNWETLHRVVMEPETGTFKVAFDNAFAGKAPLHPIRVDHS